LFLFDELLPNFRQDVTGGPMEVDLVRARCIETRRIEFQWRWVEIWW
jgi:hypothetical protein